MKTAFLVRIGLVSSTALLIGGVMAPIAVAQPPAGMGGQDRELVAQFDTDGDKRLNTQERDAARAWLATQPAAGRGGPGGGGRGPGFAGGPPPGGDFASGFPPQGGRGGGGRSGPPGGGEGEHVAMVVGSKGASVTPAAVTRYPASTPLYDPTALRTLFLEFESDDWETELAAFNNTDVDVPAAVTVDGKTYADVGVHFRGNSSYSQVPAGSKRSLNLSFDFADADQRLLGYKSLNLLNAMNDPTFVRTALYSQIARDFIAAPKVNLVRVVINGEDWGVYVNAQQYNKDLAKEAFDEDGGARFEVPGSPGARGGLEYLGDDIAAYKATYEIKSKDDPADWARLAELTRVLNQTPTDQLEAALAPILDVDETLKFLAIDVALSNSDGYWTRASDYSLYLDEAGRFYVLPHDMNEAMSGNTSLDALVAVDDATKPLRSRLLAVPALRERYMGYVHQIASDWLTWDKLGPIVGQYDALASLAVRADTRKLYATAAYDSSLESLKTWVEARRSFLLR